jgi:glycosyltransferase involved in cell wall biosynthesis
VPPLDVARPDESRAKSPLAQRPLRVALLTTYYPRHEGDSAGLFVSDAVDRIRERGIVVDVVAPGVYNDYGLAYGWGVVRNLKRRPWAVPLMLFSMLRAIRRAARSADLVHVHWLLAAPLGLLSGRPFVVTLHGTPSAGAFEDLTLLRRARWLFGPLLRRARAVICVSRTLADAASALGANAVVIPNGVDIPPNIGEEAHPPEILFAGRLAEEKGIEELAIAAEGMNLVVAGEGPLLHLVPQALGRVSHDVLEELYARAAVFVLPSRSEGFGVVCAEAMAHGRPVVGSRVGGLAELIVDGETGILVPPRRPDLLRKALQRLLDQPELRRKMGAAGRDRIIRLCSWDRVIDATVETYVDALRRSTARP